MNITGTLPEAGNLKLIITRPLPEKTCAAIEGVYTKADRKLSKMDRNTSKYIHFTGFGIFRQPRNGNYVRTFLTIISAVVRQILMDLSTTG